MSKKCTQYGESHCIEYSNGCKDWYQEGLLHREDGPAVDWINMKRWYFRGQLHRIGGPAEMFTDSTKRWYKYGKLHNVDGPAVERPVHGNQRWCRKWYQNGILHRIDGPAVEAFDGNVFNDKEPGCEGLKEGETAWFFEGHKFTQDQMKFIEVKIRRRQAKTRTFILNTLIPKIYDPNRASGRRRMIESYVALDMH